jgi:hypothetical protein
LTKPGTYAYNEKELRKPKPKKLGKNYDKRKSKRRTSRRTNQGRRPIPTQKRRFEDAQ